MRMREFIKMCIEDSLDGVAMTWADFKDAADFEDLKVTKEDFNEYKNARKKAKLKTTSSFRRREVRASESVDFFDIGNYPVEIKDVGVISPKYDELKNLLRCGSTYSLSELLTMLLENYGRFKIHLSGGSAGNIQYEIYFDGYLEGALIEILIKRPDYNEIKEYMKDFISK